MKLTMLIGLLLAPVLACAQTYIAPYVTRDGTFVKGHFRSAPNDTKADNYSAKGSINPYTGQAGKADPYVYTTPTYTVPNYRAPSWSVEPVAPTPRTPKY